ncbi:MAG: radical SAM protein [Clostridia bacterium]|nr:radical SAM protein [Clostridia bacterium]
MNNGSTRDEFPFRLRSCVWEITLACCFRCAYCGSRAGEARENELSTEECLSVAEQLADMGCRRVSMIGGEVFMRPDWETIVGALTSRGVITCIITNGFRMTEPIIAALKRVGIESVAVSIDGVAEVHDKYRLAGSYERAMAALDVLSEAGIPVSVISALRADNAPRIPEFYEILKTKKIFAWQIQACSPMGNAAGDAVDVKFDAEKVMKFVAENAGVDPFYIGIADNIGYYTPEEAAIRGKRGLVFEGCSAGLTTLGIDSVGNVRGCESMYDERFNEGNLRERSLRDIWRDPDAFTYNRKFTPGMLAGGCAECPKGPVCAGGCRSYNWFTTGKLYENALCPRSGINVNNG